MKQASFQGFGPQGMLWRAPADMPAAIVVACKTEAQAVARSLSFAKARFGYTQATVAKLCGWASDNHLSAYKRGSAPLPDDEKRWRTFAQVTGCNLLSQVRARDAANRIDAGRMTENERERAVLAQMLEAA